MADCPNHHPNAAGATFCTTCGLAMGQNSAAPSIQNLVTPMAGSPGPQPTQAVPPNVPALATTASSRGIKPPAVAAAVGTALALALVIFLIAGTFGGPRMDLESPRALLMDARDFEFDMVADSEGQAFLADEYNFFGEDCVQDRRANSLIDDAQQRSAVSFLSGDALYQYINFDQALIRMADDEEAADLVDRLRSGSLSSNCESDYEFVSTQYSGTTTLEAFGYDVDTSVVYYGKTEIDSTVLEATLRRVMVVAAQDDHVLIISASIDSSTSYVSFGELERAVQYAVDKAYGELG